LILFIFFNTIVLQGCSSSNNSEEPVLVNTKINITITANEIGSDIYLDGVYTGETTPADFTFKRGDYTIGIGLKDSKKYLKRAITVTGDDEGKKITLTDADVQAPRVWKVLFAGVKKVTSEDSDCITEYTTAQLDLAYGFLKESFQQYLEPYTYNTMKWEFYRQDFDEVVTIKDDGPFNNVFTPTEFDNITDIEEAEYDLVVTMYNGGKNTVCSYVTDGYVGLGWYDYHVLESKGAYNTIRYHNDIETSIVSAKQNDPGLFIHEWLHTTIERFYPEMGGKYPDPKNGSILHAADLYNYSFPWMTWYEDLLKGKVKSGSKYLGIGPEALLECTVRASAKSECN